MSDQQRPDQGARPVRPIGRDGLRLASGGGVPFPGRRPRRAGREALVFDLVAAFGITRVSASLLGDLTPAGLVRALVAWVAVVVGWWAIGGAVAAAPEAADRRARNLMVVGGAAMLLLGAAIPASGGLRGVVFGVCAALVPFGPMLLLGRAAGGSGALLAARGGAGVLWIAGGALGGDWGLVLWVVASAAGVAGAAIAGRAAAADPVDLAERCGAFLLLAVGESVVMLGLGLSSFGRWTPSEGLAVLFGAAALYAVWQLRFGGVEDRAAIGRMSETGRMAVSGPVVHALLLASVVWLGAGAGLAVLQPQAAMVPGTIAAAFAGPFLLVAGHALWRRAIGGRFPVSHVFAGVALLMLLPASLAGIRITVLLLTTAILLGLCVWEHLDRRGPPVVPLTRPS